MPDGENSGATRCSRSFADVVQFVALPNLPFALFRTIVSVDRPFVVADYLVLGLAAPYLPARLNLLLFAGLLLVDVFFSFVRVYHFLAAEAVYALADAVHLNHWFFVSSLVVVLGGVTLWAWLPYRSRARGARPEPPIALASLLALLLCTAGLEALVHPSIPNLIAGSIAVHAYESRGEFRPIRVQSADLWATPSATAALNSEMHNGKDDGRNVVLILVESMGLPLKGYSEGVGQSSASLRNFRHGSVPFNGSTVAAEFRELCGLGQGFRLKDTVDQAFTSECLPNRLRARGFETWSLHGYSQFFFDRWKWYPKMGFERSLFAEQLPEKDGYKRCGVQLRGVCDLDMPPLIERLLRSGGRRKFIYWVTLTSHIDLGALTTESDLLKRCDSRLQILPDDICAIAVTQRAVMDSVLKIANEPQLPPTRFIIVGDHSPAFLLRRKRSYYSDTAVPFYEFVNR